MASYSLRCQASQGLDAVLFAVFPVCANLGQGDDGPGKIASIRFAPGLEIGLQAGWMFSDYCRSPLLSTVLQTTAWVKFVILIAQYVTSQFKSSSGDWRSQGTGLAN